MEIIYENSISVSKQSKGEKLEDKVLISDVFIPTDDITECHCVINDYTLRGKPEVIDIKTQFHKVRRVYLQKYYLITKSDGLKKKEDITLNLVKLKFLTRGTGDKRRRSFYVPNKFVTDNINYLEIPFKRFLDTIYFNTKNKKVKFVLKITEL